MIDIILFGKPGAGKDTLAQHICGQYGYTEINMGKILREMAEAGDEVGVRLRDEYWADGNLVPDEDSSALAIQYVGCLGGVKKVYNGWPRTEVQVRNYFRDMKKEADELMVINVNVSNELAVNRLLGRGRIDDTEEIIKNRIKVYNKQTKSCTYMISVEFKQRVIMFNGSGTIENMYGRFDRRLGKKL